MTPEAETALRASIEHWRELTEITDIGDALTGPSSCALCGLFNKAFRAVPTSNAHYDCTGCPVQTATGEWGCGNTPYEGAQRALTPGDFLPAAREELTFLQSLLPENANEND